MYEEEKVNNRDERQHDVSKDERRGEAMLVYEGKGSLQQRFTKEPLSVVA